jgi:hypothetical protein
VRAIATVAAIFLVVAASASGATQLATPSRLTQKAVEAPRDATRQVVCTSAKGCVSVGGSYLLVERAGKWTAVRSPAPANPGQGASVGLLSLACPSAGNCVASGRYGERRAILVTESGGKWRSTVATLPGSPADPSFPALPSVACATAGSCTAVGAYDFPVATPMVVKERDGAWGNDTAAPLPANAATSRHPNHTNAGGGLSFVSCPSAGDCTAVGTYTNKDAGYGEYGWFLSDLSVPAPIGEARTASMAQLPAGSAAGGDSERGGTSPFFGFTGLSCPSVGSCTAVGGYVDRHDDQQGVIFTKRGAGWSQGVKAPMPANAGPNAAPANSFENPLASLSCAAAGDCAAIGWYVDKSKHRRGLLLTEQSGKWKASELVLPAGGPRNAVANLGSVSCASRGNCVAVGYYASAGKTYGLLVAERGGKWGRAAKAALPANAGKAHTFLNSVSCSSAKACTVVGDYADRSGTTEGLLLSLRFS